MCLLDNRFKWKFIAFHIDVTDVTTVIDVTDVIDVIDVTDATDVIDVTDVTDVAGVRMGHTIGGYLPISIHHF